MVQTEQTHLSVLQSKIEDRSAQIAVIGLGYVGQPLARRLVANGFKVRGIEQDQENLAALLQGRLHTGPASAEDVELLQRLSPTGNLRQLSSCDVIIICVPTPLTRNLEPDLSHVVHVSEAIGQHIKPGALVVLESTTYPGTTVEVVKPHVEAGGRVSQVGVDYFLAFSPERVDPGNPGEYTAYNTTKVLGGATPSCSSAAESLYQLLFGGAEFVKVASTTQTAEMEKLFENIFRSVNIALVNELAILCRAMHLDVWEIIELAGTKPYGFMPFAPGPGIGGHSLPLYPFYLSWKAREFDFHTRFIELAGELNERMPSHVVELTSEVLAEKGLGDARILIVGAAYKPNIRDSVESPSAKIAELLQRKGAKISLFDPLAQTLTLKSGEMLTSIAETELHGFDATILVTIHDGMDLEVLCSSAPRIVDTRGKTRGRDLPGTIVILGVG